ALSPELAARWGLLLPGQYIQNLAATPQVNVVGPVAAEMWQQSMGQHVDGVMVMDIEALHQILTATGPVSANGTEVDADNVVPLLMHGQYTELSAADADRADRREMLGALARATFDAANSGNSNLTKLATGLARAGNGRHAMVWSADPHVEALWQQAGAAGQLGSQDLTANVLNFGSNKLDWFLDVGNTLDVAPGRGKSELTLHVRLRNRTPPGEAS